jgi:hypothetical protein
MSIGHLLYGTEFNDFARGREVFFEKALWVCTLRCELPPGLGVEADASSTRLVL